MVAQRYCLFQHRRDAPVLFYTPRAYPNSNPDIRRPQRTQDDARPLEFVNIQVQEKAADNVNSALWNSITGRKLPPYHTRIRPNACGFNLSAAADKQEVVNPGVAGSCFLQMTNAMVQAGLRPVYIDVHGTGVSSNPNTVWRPTDGTA